MSNVSDEYYRDQGIAIYVKGELVFGLSPIMLEEKLRKLNNGDVVFNWQGLIDHSKPLIKCIK